MALICIPKLTQLITAHILYVTAVLLHCKVSDLPCLVFGFISCVCGDMACGRSYMVCKVTDYFRELNIISTGCNALKPVPSRICWRQEVPGAATRVFPGLSAAFRTAGKRTISPMAIEVL